MAVWSEIPFSSAWQEQRFGSEFWMPKYLEPLKHNKNWTLIGDLLIRAQYGISQEMNEEDIGTPIYRMNEMDGLFLSVPSKSVEISEKEYNEFRLSVGDVLFNRTNSYKFVGRTGILKDKVDAVFASYLIRLIPDTSRLLPEYLTIYLNSPTGIAQVKRRAMESINQANVSGSEIQKVPIPLLSLTFQRSIAALVNKAARAREQSIEKYDEAQVLLLNELGLNGLELSSQLTYQRNFSDMQTASRYDAEYFQPKYQRAMALMSRSSESIKDVAKLAKRRFEPQYNSSFNYIEIGSLSSGGYAESEELAGDEAPSRAQFIVRKDDVITSTVRPIRRLSALIEQQQDGFVCSSGFAVLEPRNIVPEVLLVYLRLPIICEILDLFTAASMYPAISVSNLLNLPITLPSNTAQQQIMNKVRDSRRARHESKRLLEEAKQRVEEMILGGEM